MAIPRFALNLVSPAYIADALRDRLTMLEADLAALGSRQSIMAGPTAEIKGRIAEAGYWKTWVENIQVPVGRERP